MKKTILALLLSVLMITTLFADNFRYPAGGPTSSIDSNVMNVTLTGQSTSINYTPTAAVIGLDDQTALVATLIPGQEYSVSVEWGTFNTYGSVYAGAGSVWIDWDQDEAYATTELIGSWTGTPIVTESYTFTAPVDFTGSTRMRVMQQEGSLVTLPLDPAASYSYGSMMDFTVAEYVAGTPDVPVLVSPLNGASNVAIDANLEWTTGDNTDHTVLYISESEDFTGVAGIDPASSPYTTSLTSGTTYFWKVVAVNGALEATSAVYSFTTVYPAISEFPWTESFDTDELPGGWLANPAIGSSNAWELADNTDNIGHGASDEATGNDGYYIAVDDSTPYTPTSNLYSPMFDLSAINNPRLGFKYWIGDAANNSELHIDIITGEGTDESVATITDPLGSTEWIQYYLPLDDYNNEIIGFNFRVIEDQNNYYGDVCLDDVTVEEIPLPTAASNPVPNDDAVGVATSPLLTWTNPESASHIDLYFGPVGNMELVLNNVPAVSQYQVNDLDAGTEYEWKVVGRNVTGETPEIDVLTWSFTTTSEPPLATTYISPSDQATGLSPKGSLSWNSVAGANGYYVYISTDETFADVVTPEDVSEVSYNFNLDYATTYYWKVIPYNTSGSPTEGILVWSFTIMDSPFPAADVVFDGVRSGNHGMPMEPYYGYTITQNIYYQEEINVTDSAITSISYLYNNASAWSETIEVYMKHTSKETFADNEDWDLTGFTNVYSGSMTVDTSNPIVTISLNNPFVYNNSDNLMVMFFATQSGYNSSSDEFYNYPVEGNRSLTGCNDGANYHDYFPGATPVGTLKAYLPVTGFNFEMLPTEAVFTLSAEELTFAETELDMTSASQTLSISNGGLADLGITGITLAGANADQFQLTDNNTYSVSLATGEDMSVEVTYAPNAVGEHIAELQITDDQMRVLHTVPITASSVDNYIYATDMPWSESFESELYDWRAIVQSTSSYAGFFLTSDESNVQDGLTAIGFTNSADANPNLQLISPTFYSGLTSTRLTFWTKGSTGCSLIVGTYDHQIGTFNEIETITLTSDYAKQDISFLPSRTSQRLAFKAVFDGTSQNIYLDNLQVVEIPDSPQFEISANNLEFAHAIINDTELEEQIVTVRNTGMATLELNDIRLRGDNPDQFTIIHDPLPINLEINETSEIKVTFSPTTEGIKSATLNIGDNIEARATNIVNLSGTAVDPTIYANELDPYFLDFENAQQILGWEANINSTSTSASAERYQSSSSAYEGDYSFRIYHPSSATSDFEVVSPLIVPDMDLYRVRFMAKTSSLTNTDPLVIGKYNAAMDTFTEIQALTLTTSYAEYTVDLIENEPLSRANERLVFKFQTEQSASKYIYLDNVRIEDIPLVPLAELNVEAINFGMVPVLTSVDPELLTITNVGPGTLNISSVEITGADAGLFAWEYVEETPDMALENGESLEINVTFTPDGEGVKVANLIINDDLARNVRISSASKAVNNSRAENLVSLTGEGIIGDSHNNPIILSLAETIIDEGVTTPYNPYFDFCGTSPSVVYTLSLPQAKLMDISLEGSAFDTRLWVFNSYDQIDQATSNLDAWHYNDDNGAGGVWSSMSQRFSPAGDYYIVIAGFGSAYGEYTITINTEDLPAPAAATSPSPADEAVDQPTALTLTWNNADYTETVDLWFGPTPEPANSRSLMATRSMVKFLDNVAAVEEYAVTDLDPDTEYSWKVVCRNYSGETIAEDVVTWTFTTIGNAPDAVTYTAPADEAPDVALNGNLTWQAATGANGYYVYLSTDENFTGVDAVDQTATTYAYSGLDYETTYYWKVIPYNAVGQPTEGIQVWSFTTIPDPTIPMPVLVDFENGNTSPDEITSKNMFSTTGHGNTSTVLYKNVWSASTDAYIQFQSMNGITATSVINFDYRIVDYGSPYPGTEMLVDHDYFEAFVSVDNGDNFTVLDQINSLNHVTTDAMTNYTINIGELAGQSAIFRFEMNWDGDSDYFFDIDNIYFGEPATTPIAQLSATEIDFGTVNVGQTANDEVTISNIGVGTLNISTIEIVGDNADDFAYSTDPEASMALGEDQSLVISLDFTPSAEGVRNATLQITDDLGRRFRVNTATKNTSNNRSVNEVALSGDGYIPPQGSVCSNPLPLEFPAVDITGNTADYGDDYENAHLNVSTYYLSGDDVVYQFTVETDVLLNGTITGDDDYTGAFIVSEEPNAENPVDVINMNTGGSGITTLTYTDVEIPAGTYFLIISTWTAPQSFNYTINLTATPDVVIPEIPTSVSISADGATITLSWEAAANATSYNVYACDTPDGDYVFVENVEGLTTTITASDSMKFFRVKGSNSGAPELASKGFRRQ